MIGTTAFPAQRAFATANGIAGLEPVLGLSVRSIACQSCFGGLLFDSSFSQVTGATSFAPQPACSQEDPSIFFGHQAEQCNLAKIRHDAILEVLLYSLSGIAMRSRVGKSKTCRHADVPIKREHPSAHCTCKTCQCSQLDARRCFGKVAESRRSKMNNNQWLHSYVSTSRLMSVAIPRC